MSNPCLAPTCLNGNCPGCRNSVQDCSDPRCFPNCPNCPNTSTSNNSNWHIVTIILVLLAILLVLSFIIGYSWYKDRKKASEPKRVTVNKHMHTVVPPAIVVTSPAPIMAPVVSPISNCPGNISPVQVVNSSNIPETLSYNNMKFSLN
jgi:hypothetical protein